MTRATRQAGAAAAATASPAASVPAPLPEAGPWLLDTLSSATATISTPMHVSSPRPGRSCRTRRDSTIVPTRPEACRGCATVSGSRDSTSTCRMRPPRISVNPASHAGAVNSVRISRHRWLASIGGRVMRARFSSTKPTL